MKEEKSILEQLAEEGFKDTGRRWADMPIMKTDKEIVLYNKATKKVYLRYEIKKEVYK